MMRVRTFAVTAVAAALLAGLVSTWPVRADTVAPMNPGPGQTVDKTYGAILGEDPQEASSNALGDQHAAPTPSTCATLPSCNVIPLTFQVPKGFSTRDTYVATISLFFETQSISPGYAGVSAGTNDLDLYLWAEAANEPECTSPPKNTTPPDYCTTDLALSANGPGTMPEVVRADASSRQKFLLEVSNSGGNDTSGYRIHVESRYLPYTSPDESIGPSSLPAAGDSGSAPAPPFTLPDLSTGGGSAAPSATGAPVSLPSLTSSGDLSGLDPDLTNINGANLSSLLKGPLLKSASVKVAPPGSPSTGSILLWLLVLPLVLAAAATAVFLRRRPSALRI